MIAPENRPALAWDTCGQHKSTVLVRTRKRTLTERSHAAYADTWVRKARKKQVTHQMPADREATSAFTKDRNPACNSTREFHNSLNTVLTTVARRNHNETPTKDGHNTSAHDVKKLETTPDARKARSESSIQQAGTSQANLVGSPPKLAMLSMVHCIAALQAHAYSNKDISKLSKRDSDT
jgi:hypothetical protein